MFGRGELPLGQRGNSWSAESSRARGRSGESANVFRPHSLFSLKRVLDSRGTSGYQLFLRGDFPNFSFHFLSYTAPLQLLLHEAALYPRASSPSPCVRSLRKLDYSAKLAQLIAARVVVLDELVRNRCTIFLRSVHELLTPNFLVRVTGIRP